MEAPRLWDRDRVRSAVAAALLQGLLAYGLIVGLAGGPIQNRMREQLTVFGVLPPPPPPLAWVVFAIAWFKVTHAGAAFVISIGVFWINYFATYGAVRHIDPRLYELARSFGQGGYWRRAWSITLPAIAPGALAGTRAGIGQAWMTLIAAELLGVPGMGQEMNAAAGVGDYNAVVVYMLAISLVYAASDLLYVCLEKKVLAWRP